MNLLSKFLKKLGLTKKPILYMPHAFKSDEARDIWLNNLHYSTLAAGGNRGSARSSPLLEASRVLVNARCHLANKEAGLTRVNSSIQKSTLRDDSWDNNNQY